MRYCRLRVGPSFVGSAPEWQDIIRKRELYVLINNVRTQSDEGPVSKSTLKLKLLHTGFWKPSSVGLVSTCAGSATDAQVQLQLMRSALLR